MFHERKYIKFVVSFILLVLLTSSAGAVELRVKEWPNGNMPPVGYRFATDSMPVSPEKKSAETKFIPICIDNSE